MSKKSNSTPSLRPQGEVIKIPGGKKEVKGQVPTMQKPPPPPPKKKD
jgi:hypothetical protein